MPREFRLLEFLVRHAGQTVTRTMLLEGVWKYRFEPETKIIDVQMSRLRQKINRGFEAPLIHTVRGSDILTSMRISACALRRACRTANGEIQARLPAGSCCLTHCSIAFAGIAPLWRAISPLRKQDHRRDASNAVAARGDGKLFRIDLKKLEARFKGRAPPP